MSTRLTEKGTPMVDSHSLQLVMQASQVSDGIARYLSSALESKGYQSASPSALSFLSALDCGVNYGSDIARNLGVSRQMVAKTVKAMCLAGYLEQSDGPGKQKPIHFTLLGEKLIADARQLMADLDKSLETTIGEKATSDTIEHLAALNNLIKML